MASVTRGRPPESPGRRAGPAAAPAAAARPLSAVLEQQRQRAVTAVLDVARLTLTAFVGRFAERVCGHAGGADLAALEADLRDALLALGATVLMALVRLRGTGFCGSSYVCPCGARLVLKEVAALQQRTWFGPITLERAVYVPAGPAAGAACTEHAHRVPLDAAWGLLGAAPPLPALPDPDGGALAPVAPGDGPARLAPGFAAVVVEFGARLPYAEAAWLLERALGAVAHLAPNTVRAYTQAAGRARATQEDALRVRTRPPTRAERRAVVDTPAGAPPAGAPDVLAVSLDGALERTRAGWKEVKLGAVCDLVAGRAAGAAGAAAGVLAVGKMTYTATLAPAQDFGRQLLAVAQRRGLRWAGRAVVLGDGAKWIWKLADRRFPRAVQVVDWYHAHEHLWGLAQLLYGEGTAAAWTWLETLAGSLWAAETAAEVALVGQAAGEAWEHPDPAPAPEAPVPRRTARRRQEVAQAVAYFTSNAARMRYGHFRAQQLPVGSGFVEGGCQHVLHSRLKRPGAHWGAEAAEHMVRARAVVCSDPTPACGHPEDRLAC